LEGLRESIETFSQQLLENISVKRARSGKLIRDAVTGTIFFEPHEINILDMPFVQRLRRIHQTGLAFITYPSVEHSRFQHTLGVVKIVTTFTTFLREKEEYKDLLDPNTVRELRFAAMLHDIGHGPFSHPTEELIAYFPEVKSELLNNPKFSKAKPHEMLSYFIVTSDAFRKIINQINATYNKNIDIDRVANMIVGDMDDPMETYLSDLINGPFDADKLDYMSRDAYFSGLTMTTDLERIAYTSGIGAFLLNSGNSRRLFCDITGAHNLEQVLFNKLFLYSSMYHHHKVRAATCMLKSIFEIIWDRNLEIDGLNFKHAVDFLSIDDYDIFTKFRREPNLANIIENIRNRRVFKKALVISALHVKNPIQYQKLCKYAEDPINLRKIRELIVDEVSRRGGECTIYDIWLDIPAPPSLREASQCFIRLTEKGDYDKLSTIFPIHLWFHEYMEAKWRSYIFCPPKTSLRRLVNEASRKVLGDMGIECTEAATRDAKIP